MRSIGATSPPRRRPVLLGIESVRNRQKRSKSPPVGTLAMADLTIIQLKTIFRGTVVQISIGESSASVEICVTVPTPRAEGCRKLSAYCIHYQLESLM